MDEVSFPKKQDKPKLISKFINKKFSHHELIDSDKNVIWSNNPYEHIIWMGIIEKVEDIQFFVRYIDENGENRGSSIDGELHRWFKIFEQTNEYNIGDLFVCLRSGYKLFISPENHWRFYNNKNIK